jgi:hypothetical protein
MADTHETFSVRQCALIRQPSRTPLLGGDLLTRAGRVVVGYEVDGVNWKLSISDDGVGFSDRVPSPKRTGLGTSLVKALAQQLEAQVEIASSPTGTNVLVTHATFVSRLPHCRLTQPCRANPCGQAQAAYHTYPRRMLSPPGGAVTAMKGKSLTGMVMRRQKRR